MTDKKQQRGGGEANHLGVEKELNGDDTDTTTTDDGPPDAISTQRRKTALKLLTEALRLNTTTLTQRDKAVVAEIEQAVATHFRPHSHANTMYAAKMRGLIGSIKDGEHELTTDILSRRVSAQDLISMDALQLRCQSRLQELEDTQHQEISEHLLSKKLQADGLAMQQDFIKDGILKLGLR
jgi:hypothetical protein